VDKNGPKRDVRNASRVSGRAVTPIWVPDETMKQCGIWCGRDSAAEDQRHKRQLISAFFSPTWPNLLSQTLDVRYHCVVYNDN
jgi:hypothetical protein